MSKVLITGGTGMIGSKLSDELKARGHEVFHLSRSANPEATYPSFAWNLEKQFVNTEILRKVDIIVHLAGASINQRWTEKNKKKIIDSRVESARLLHREITRLNIKLKSFVSMSATGYYGGDTGDRVLSESDEPGNDFLAEVVMKWEAAADLFQPISSVTKLRTGVVLDSDGGALSKIAMPARLGAGAPIGSGRQWMSWIHVEDVVNAFAEAVDGKIQGTFNLVASEPETNASLSKQIAKSLGRPFFFPNVPAFALKLFLGEMSIIVTGGNKVDNAKLVKTGFNFKFPKLKDALDDLLIRK